MQITQNEPTTSERRIPFLAVRASAHSLQILDLGDIGTGDSFTLTLDSQTTSSINVDTDLSAAIVTALEALSNVEEDDVEVFKLSDGDHVYAIGFGGTFTGTSVALLTITETGFTAGGITGGVADSPVVGLGADWPAADIEVSKAGGAYAEGDGAVAEVGHGVYAYEADAAEVDTLGALVGVVLTLGVSVWPFSAQVVPAASGSTVLHSGTAQAGASGSITLASGASSTSDYYVPCLVKIVAGTGAGQGGRIMSSYNGTSKVASVAPSWITVPDATSEYELEPIGAIPVEDIAAEVREEIDDSLDTYDPPTNAEMEARTLMAAQYAAAADLAILDNIVDDVLARIGSPSVTLAADIASGAAPSANTVADALLDRTNGIETSITLRQALRVMLAVLAGKATVSGATTTFRNVGDTKDRVTSIATAAGARTSVTVDGD